MRIEKLNQKGFTLIELMIVIAIVAILVALAVPAYQDYTIRTKVGECVNGAAPAKLSISEYYQSQGIYPPDTNQAGFVATSGTSQFCDAWGYTAGTGTIRINIDEAAVNPSAAPGVIAPDLIPTPEGTTGVVNWRCARGGTVAASYKYLPSSCRGT